ncbi:MAG: FAD-dependent oxidoreductase, partial [Clostridia bacterium]|nr:FAD-dependent oxidoreductase [Clostridia bacterium]
VGKLGYPDLAEQALRDELCDMIMLGRPLLADAEWCNKAYKGEVKEIRPCIGCQEACLNEFVEGGHPQCAVNPRTAFEDEYSREIPKAEVKKYVAVVGAGPAGVVAAETLIKRGHAVDLYEKNVIGGNIVPGSKPKIKYELKNYLDYLKSTVEKLKKNKDFELIKGSAVAESMKAKGYDAVLVATGAGQTRPDLPGIDSENVLFAVDVLNNPKLVRNAQSVVVIGGGVVGAETAYFLKYECGKDVKVVEMDKYIMNHTCTANRGHIIHYLEEAGVKLLNCTKVRSIEGNMVKVIRNKHKNVPDPYVTWKPILPENIPNPMDSFKKIENEYVEEKLFCDIIVLATGVKPEDTLYYDCVSKHVADEIYNIGDSYKGAKVFEAVRAAYRCARNI